MSSIFTSSRGALLVTFFKRRWLGDVLDLIEETFAREDGALSFDDIDMDNDFRELVRVTGPQALSELASGVLRAEDELPAGMALEALAPELEGDLALVFLQLLAANLAFRLRTPELLADLAAFSAREGSPRLAPSDLGALLGRCMLEPDARRLIEAAGFEAEDQAEALAALSVTEVDLIGTRIHVLGDLEALEKGLDRALRPRERAGWTQGVGQPSRRRLLAHKQRGGWFTLLEEGDVPPLELAQALATTAGVNRVAWIQVGLTPEDLDLRVLEGTRTTLDRAGLTALVGAEADAGDAAAFLRSLGVLDLDPGHARRIPLLRWAQAAGLDFKKKSINSYCYL
ncbi:MAG: hypothetical protein JKY65_17000 [Planctomycetes bacterium]|nr:hypothetical protein [Planctomycetota bacterium]